jgi:hypothetical protein
MSTSKIIDGIGIAGSRPQHRDDKIRRDMGMHNRQEPKTIVTSLRTLVLLAIDRRDVNLHTVNEYV